MGLLRNLRTNVEIRHQLGDIPIESLYTVGIAGEKFFRALKDQGKLLASHHAKSGKTYLLPRAFCEEGFDGVAEWREVEPRGTVKTFTVCRIGLNRERLDRPTVVGLIEFEGITGGIVHYLGGVAADDVEIGMAVEMVLKPQAERTGSILDIRHFRPVAAPAAEASGEAGAPPA